MGEGERDEDDERKNRFGLSIIETGRADAARIDNQGNCCSLSVPPCLYRRWVCNSDGSERISSAASSGLSDFDDSLCRHRHITTNLRQELNNFKKYWRLRAELCYYSRMLI
ncbi:hypothetical protein GWI33_000457 [Rhynchophorus ferrugineus]|uniref:Uncharacterized protein n=1 Tax=Rhynchophorus ferrugineus TaxID=354439 RepID=A0A834HZE2_RHYFE|nr:hypothetical protein GWI33_000460 [Rhynchophorus ferrugineus]KAF7264222.1 hypothetical protein GWI33_000457 [Rhynchophorus ferrugineus]